VGPDWREGSGRSPSLGAKARHTVRDPGRKVLERGPGWQAERWDPPERDGLTGVAGSHVGGRKRGTGRSGRYAASEARAARAAPARRGWRGGDAGRWSLDWAGVRCFT
jgi:hypothetical protein